MENKIVKIISNILVFIVAILSSIVVYNFIQLKLLKKTYVNYFGYAFFEVVTGSMAPSIQETDVVIVKIGNDAGIDDIVTFESNGTYITHRVIDVQNNYYITRGDANNTNDSPVLKKDVLGRVVKIIPKFGIWQAILTDSKVIICLLVTLFFFSLAFARRKKQAHDFKIKYNSIIMEKENE